eukprot:scaffold36274_cov125-Isochrysis_galbana.AAC.16
MSLRAAATNIDLDRSMWKACPTVILFLTVALSRVAHPVALVLAIGSPVLHLSEELRALGALLCALPLGIHTCRVNPKHKIRRRRPPAAAAATRRRHTERPQSGRRRSRRSDQAVRAPMLSRQGRVGCMSPMQEMSSCGFGLQCSRRMPAEEVGQPRALQPDHGSGVERAAR